MATGFFVQINMEIKKIHSLFLNSRGITIDSRKIEEGQIFFALKGASFNGNKFALSAINQGAKYAVVDEAEFATRDNIILVEDVLLCLQELAKFHRSFLNVSILAITGTNGKTTTKELISAVLKKKFTIGFTKGNLNNHIGVPLTLLSFNSLTEIGIVEMGANHPGEIEFLCSIAAPDYGIITNIGKAHIEGFGSFEGVVKTKNELYNYLKINKKPIFINGEDELLMSLSEGMTKYTYGIKKDFNICAGLISANPLLSVQWDNYVINTKLVGAYNLTNVLAAICVGAFFDVDDDLITSAIRMYQPQNNRSQLTKTPKNTLIIDAYNANPTSMDLAINNFTNINDDNKTLILGDMFELGSTSDMEHKNIIDLVKKLKFDSVIFVGSHFYKLANKKKSNFKFFENTQELCNYLSKNELINRTILLKASRGIQLEKVIEFL